MAVDKRFGGWVLAVALLVSTVGCGSSSDSGTSGGGSSMDQMAAQLDVQEAARQKEEARLAAEKKAQEEAAAQAPPEVRVVTAHSPKKGRSLEGGGYLSVVTGTRFWAEHQLILDNIRHAVDLFEATNSRYPKDQDEFMREIIKANEPATRLPELPEGWEYFYDPKDPLVLKMKNTGSGQEGAVD